MMLECGKSEYIPCSKSLNMVIDAKHIQIPYIFQLKFETVSCKLTLVCFLIYNIELGYTYH
jgi:hypothetical protein